MSDFVRPTDTTTTTTTQVHPDNYKWSGDNGTTLTCHATQGQTDVYRWSGDGQGAQGGSDPFAAERTQRNPETLTTRSKDGGVTNNYFVNGDLYINDGSGHQTIEHHGSENHTVTQSHHHHKHKPTEAHKHHAKPAHAKDSTAAVKHEVAHTVGVANSSDGQCVSSRSHQLPADRQPQQNQGQRAMVNAYRNAYSGSSPDSQSWNPTPGNYYDRSSGAQRDQVCQNPAAYQTYDYYQNSGGAYDNGQQHSAQQRYSDYPQGNTQQYDAGPQYNQQSQYEYQQPGNYPPQQYEYQQPGAYQQPYGYAQGDAYSGQPYQPQPYLNNYNYPVSEYPAYYPPQRHHGLSLGFNIGGFSIGLNAGNSNYGYGYEPYGYGYNQTPMPMPRHHFRSNGW